jgi:type III pantothenate kinase
MKRLLVADVGNTNIHFGEVVGPRIVKDLKVPTQRVTQAYLAGLFKRFDSIAACSVVPSVNKLFRQAGKKSRTAVLFAGEDVAIPIKNRYKQPSSVGKDRLVNCYAALQQDETVRLVIDCGTALTIDFLSDRKEYLGGAIIPGIGLSLQSLSSHCALLPKHIFLPKDKVPLIGKTTQKSIISGILWGYTSICQYYIEQYRRQLKKDFSVCLTGGDSGALIKYVQAEHLWYDPLLILKGIVFLMEGVRHD